MKKIVALVLVLCLLQGCAYYKYTLIKARGKDLQIPIGQGVFPVKGKGVVITVLRQVFLMPGKVEVQKFIEIDIDDDVSKGDMKITNSPVEESGDAD